MTRWSADDARTERPEELSLLARAKVLLTGVSIPRPENRLTPRDVRLPFEVQPVANGRGDELEAWYVPLEGAHLVAVLFHGYAARKDMMLGVARGLRELGCSVLLVDFHGSGGSSGSGTSLGIHEAHDVRAAVDHCRARWPDRRLVLYGQSMGGAAVLRAVARLGVEPDGLVLESTFDRLLSTVANRFHRMGLPATPFAELLVFWGGCRVGANAFEHDPVEYATSVRCPTLVLAGGRDSNVSLEQARSICAQIGSWKRCSEYAKVGHEDVRTADPERWIGDVRALLEQVLAEPAASR